MKKSSDQIPYTFAFQPIVDTELQTVFSYEALIRGLQKESPDYIFSKVSRADMLSFVKEVNIRSVLLASKLGIDCYLNLNFLPSFLQASSQYINRTLEATLQHGLRKEQIVIEITEKEAIENQDGFTRLINQYRAMGIKVAIDDFGAGYSGLNLLANFQPDIVKLDMQLVHDIDSNGPRQAIVSAVCQLCFDLGIDIIAEGVETLNEYHWLKNQKINLYQGYLFAKPGFECLPEVVYPD